MNSYYPSTFNYNQLIPGYGEMAHRYVEGGFQICIGGLSFWLMRIIREIGHGAAL